VADDPRMAALFPVIGVTTQRPNLNVAKPALVAQNLSKRVAVLAFQVEINKDKLGLDYSAYFER
jgi:hypothetical protein